MKWYAKLYTRLVFIFLYLPIIVLIVFSFNESKSRANWTGFSFHWYKELFHNELISPRCAIPLSSRWRRPSSRWCWAPWRQSASMPCAASGSSPW